MRTFIMIKKNYAILEECMRSRQNIIMIIQITLI